MSTTATSRRHGDDVKIANVRLEDVRVHAHNVRRDLGDLRSLVDSIRRFGIMQPIVVEHRGDHFRLRAGHRRLAAAYIAGLKRIPAIIHGEALADDEWLVHAVQENVIRRGLDPAERAGVIDAMRRERMTWQAIADAFGVSVSTIRAWTSDTVDEPAADEPVAYTLGGPEPRPRPARPATKPKAPHTRLSTRTLRTFTDAWREHAATHDVTVEQLLDALDHVAETATISDFIPPKAEGDDAA